MTQESRASLYVGALIGSVVGYLLLVFGTFGGWYSYGYYVRTWGYVGGFAAPGSIPILAALGLPFLGCAVVSLRAVRNPAALTRGMANLGLALAITQFSIIALGAVAFVVLVSGNDSWWFDAGFYGSAIGGILTLICLVAARGGTRAPAAAYGPYAPAYAPPYANAPPAYAPYPQAPYASPAAATLPPPTPQPAPPAPPPQTAPPAYAPYPQAMYAPPPPADLPPSAPPSARFCSRCGAPVAPGHRFCAACGSPIA